MQRGQLGNRGVADADRGFVSAAALEDLHQSCFGGVADPLRRVRVGVDLGHEVGHVVLAPAGQGGIERLAGGVPVGDVATPIDGDALGGMVGHRVGQGDVLAYIVLRQVGDTAALVAGQ